MNTRGDVGLGAILIIIIIIVLALGWLINEGWKECRYDSDCGDVYYCISYFVCNEIPVIEQRVEQAAPVNIPMAAAWVIGLSLIIAAIIFKWDTFKRKPKEKTPEQKKEEEQDKQSQSYKAEPTDPSIEEYYEEH
jgi:hypothetical protein